MGRGRRALDLRFVNRPKGREPKSNFGDTRADALSVGRITGAENGRVI